MAHELLIEDGQAAMMSDIVNATAPTVSTGEEQSPKSAQSLFDAGRSAVLEFVGDQQNQPSARELLQYLEAKLGWLVRWHFLAIIKSLQTDANLPRFLRNYVRTNLT